jgi:hypothetical protein
MKSYRTIYLALALLGISACSFSTILDSRQNSVSFPTALPSSSATPTLEPAPTMPPTPLVTISTYRIIESKDTDRYSIDLEMPDLKGPAEEIGVFNQVVSNYAEKSQSDFRQNAIEAARTRTPDMPDTSSYLSSETHLAALSARLVSISVSMHNYILGAAHPSTYSVSFNYDLTAKKILALADLFQSGSGYLDVISSYCLAELKKNPDIVVFEEGVTPKDANFQNWNITNDGLQITFDPSQVAPYAVGTQVVVIPYDTLQGILSPLGEEIFK